MILSLDSVHFSAHDITRESGKDASNLSVEDMTSALSKCFNSSTGNAAQAILEEKMKIKTRYLRDEELTSLITMMNKRRIVTLVLSCCFSERLMRISILTSRISHRLD